MTGRRVVRLLGRHRTWSSEPLLADDAKAYMAELRRDIAAAGDGPALIAFRCGDGREVAVRARELVAVEHQACTTAAVPS